jgi:hypothetical protein
VNEHRLVALVSHRRQERVHDLGIRHRHVECRWMYFNPAACAAARPASTSAPGSLASLRLTTETKPSFFSADIALGSTAPPQPTVASTRE